MTTLGVLSKSETDFDVTGRHFGGNIIGSLHSDNGATHDHFRTAIDALDISDLRYPAGEPDVAYAAGMLQDGGLPDHVHNFFASIEGREGEVVMVTPTFGSYTGPEELQRFAELVMESYGDKVRAWEIGNEYWQLQDEFAYGRIANEAVEAIYQGMEDAGKQSDIWVQMGNASGRASAFRDHPTLGWIDSTIEANKTIINLLSPEAIERIDGLIEHVYLRDTSQIVGNEIEATNMAYLDLDVWRTETGRDFDFAVTEWNVKTTNVEQHGLKGGSALLQHTENLLRLGVDDMHVWSPQHNTKTDLAGSDEVLIDDDTGYVKNTVIGAVFDTMSTALPGKTLLDLDIAGAATKITTHAFADGQELTVYIASRSEDVEELAFDVADAFDGAVLERALLIGYDPDPESSDGLHFSQGSSSFVEVDYLMVDGERYFYNEHDANAALDLLDTSGLASGDEFAFRLRPYEIVQLTYSIDNDTDTTPTRADDTLRLRSEPTRIDALEGNDTVNGGDANDTVHGGAGNDHLVLGAGDDHGFGEEGDDFLSGWGGDDALLGGAGNDTLFGFQGRDEIDGDAGHDVIRGGEDADLVRGGTGKDTIEGDEGSDTIYGNDHSDQIYGGAGNDILHGNDGADHLRGDAGNDTLEGGAQNDQLEGGAGRDILAGGDGFDFLEGQDGNDQLRGGGDADRLSGGAGDDQLFGGTGADFLSGGDQDDLLNGDQDNDTLLGGSGADTLAGGDGDDRMLGGAEGDLMSGDEGDDDLSGGAGADTLSGGLGDDLLAGGADSDTFEFHDNHGEDVIEDFDITGDVLDVSGVENYTSFQVVIPTALQDGEDVVLQTGNQSSVRLKNVQLDTLDAEDFVF